MARRNGTGSFGQGRGQGQGQGRGLGLGQGNGGNMKQQGSRRQKVQVDLLKCTGCGVCIASCPVGVMSLVNEKIVISDACIYCRACLSACPKGALLA